MWPGLKVNFSLSGVAWVKGTSANGYSKVSMIDHFGPFLFTGLLVDRMKEESKRHPVRIINVSGDVYRWV